MRTPSLAPIVKEIKAELKRNPAYEFYPLSNQSIYKLMKEDKYGYSKFIRDLISALRADKKVYNVESVSEEINIDEDWRNRVNVVYKISILSRPCKEFESLNHWLSKYASRRLQDREVRYDEISGKRSSYSADETYYLMHNATACKKLLECLRKARATNDKITLQTQHDIYWGDRFNSYGEDMECEWSGNEDFYTDIIIKSPTGRLKKTISAYAY